MVRETRHLWVGNLPENIREDRIREHFKRYGRVQSVKLLPRGEECPVDGSSCEGSESGGGGGGPGSTNSSGASATVAFMDIKSAAKAHATEHTIDERALTTQYYEPQHIQHRFPSHGRDRSFESAVTVANSGSRFTRYETPPRSRTSSYSRSSGGGTGASGASPGHPAALSRSNRRSYQSDSYYEPDYAEPRRFRSYDDGFVSSNHDDYDPVVIVGSSEVKLLSDEDVVVCAPRRHGLPHSGGVVEVSGPPLPPPPLLPPPPQDIRHLQKERVHLLEQLEECHSSGDELGSFAPNKKRSKTEPSILGPSSILCEPDDEIADILVTSHSGRKGVEVRRVSDSKVVVHHGSSRRGSCEGRVPVPCKRRREAQSRHHEHHDGSRPGTPLVDERPENLMPSEPRRFRERSHDGPLSLPLPRFATQILNSNSGNSNSTSSNCSSSSTSSNGGTKSSNSNISIAKIASPPSGHSSNSNNCNISTHATAIANTVPSPRSQMQQQQPPASPPSLRHTSPSPTSSDSELAPQSPTLEERIRSLDEKYEKWSGSRALSAAGSDTLSKLDASVSERFRFKHKLLEFDVHEVKPSDIVKSVLAKRSVFDEDSKRLENFSEKYEPREFTGVISSANSNNSAATTSGLSSGIAASQGKVCLQYPFPSHPPQLPQTQAGAASPTTKPSDPRTCPHPSPATPITPGTNVKTVSPELPPVLPSNTVNIISANNSAQQSLSASTFRTQQTVALSNSVLTSSATALPLSSSVTTIVSSSSHLHHHQHSHHHHHHHHHHHNHQVATPTTPTTPTATSPTENSVSRIKLKKEPNNSSNSCKDSNRDPRFSNKSKENNLCLSSSSSSLSSLSLLSRKSRKEEDAEKSMQSSSENSDLENHRQLEKREREEKERRDKEEHERKEKEEKERREKDEERIERERLEKAKQEKERKESEERERREKEEIERKLKERLEKEREDRERREREEREKKEKQEKERVRKEREEQERREREEREKLEREQRRREEKERIEKERKREREERERLDKEQRRKEKEERDKQEKERRDKEEKERHDKERREKEKGEREKRREREEKDKKEREDNKKIPSENHLQASNAQNSQSHTPASATNKRRCSSQDTGKNEDEVIETKRPKISEHRRDSKESRDGKSKSQSRRNEDRKHRSDSHRTSRESRESRESKDSNSTQDSRDGDLRESSREGKENNRDSKQRKKSRSERSEKDSNEQRSPKINTVHDPEKEFLARLELTKKIDHIPTNPTINEHSRDHAAYHHHDQHEQQNQHHNHQVHDQKLNHHMQSNINLHNDLDEAGLLSHEMQVVRNPSATDTDSDEPKKHSIFDIVEDEPAYISMYDKVKARSTKNMQKLEEEKRQVRLKDKFSQLKQSRARREEKKQSTSWDGDSVSSKALTEDEATSESDSTRTKSISRKGSRSRIHSDTSEEDETFNNKLNAMKTERYLENDIHYRFGDIEEKHHPHLEISNANVIVNNVRIKDEPRTSDDDDRLGYLTKHVDIVNNHDRDPRKKSHKKKLKRQKNSISSDENTKLESTDITTDYKTINKIINDTTDTNHFLESPPGMTANSTSTASLSENEERSRSEKKNKSKKDKRRDRNSDSKIKARRKRLNRQEARDNNQRLEDIFGPLSDEVDEAMSGEANNYYKQLLESPTENHKYHSDSDGLHSPVIDERARRKSEKKRRHHSQSINENSVDLAEAGREIEAKLLGLTTSPKSIDNTEQSRDNDIFRFTDDSIETVTPTTVPEKSKEKKKKRKKSKDERSRKDYHHHHHHHHHHHEKQPVGGSMPFIGEENASPRASSPISFSSPPATINERVLSPIPKIPSDISNETAVDNTDKKKEKFIPGFGVAVDESMHENAVKSISELQDHDIDLQNLSNLEEQQVEVPSTPTPQPEDKPRVIISQEETEDAVAALLEETFGGSAGDYSYEGEEEETETENTTGGTQDAPDEDVEETKQAVESLNQPPEGESDIKPDTPQSEHDLQIDTDTEEDPSYENYDATQPPKTPDAPSFYKTPINSSTSNSSVNTDIQVQNHLSASIQSGIHIQNTCSSSVIAHSRNVNEPKSREHAKVTSIESDMSPSESDKSLAQIKSPPSSTIATHLKQNIIIPCTLSTSTEAIKLTAVTPRSIPITAQPMYQRLPICPQTGMVSMRQITPRPQNVTTLPSSMTPVPPLVPSRMPPLVTSQLSPRMTPPQSPNGQWIRNSPLTPLVTCAAKVSAPPVRINVSVPISAHRPDISMQHIYSTASTQQPVIQHAAGMRGPHSISYPRVGLPPLSLSIPARPYMSSIPPPLTTGIQVKSIKESVISSKSVVETLVPVNNNSEGIEEPKLSPSVLAEPTSKPSTSPKIPSPNQPPVYIPETAKIDTIASTSSQIFTKANISSLSPRSKYSVSTSTDGILISPRQKQEINNIQMIAGHVPHVSASNPVIVSHNPTSIVHSIPSSVVASQNPSHLIKTAVPIMSTQSQTVHVTEKTLPQQIVTCISNQQKLLSVSQNIVNAKTHVPCVSTMSQTIISRVSTTNLPLQNKLENVNIEEVKPLPICTDSKDLKEELKPILKNETPLEQVKVEFNMEDAVENKHPTFDHLTIKTNSNSKLPEQLNNIAEPDVIPKTESKPELKTELKNDEEIDNDDESTGESTRTRSSDRLPLDGVKEEATDSKEDSDYWSAKEVNIESVIKKVDALCDGEINDNEDNEQNHDAINDSHDTSKSDGDSWIDSESVDDDSKKNYNNPDDQDEGVETGDGDSSKSRRGRSKRRGAGRGGVATRRGGRNAAGNNVNGQKRGGRVARGGKHNLEKNKLPADVYEFHDDSEEDNSGRPRLILTIKSPTPNVAVTTAQTTTPVPAVKEVPLEEFVSPAISTTSPVTVPTAVVAAGNITRKSRRLAEKDGSRSTVDDIIEDVVRGAANNKGVPSNSTATRRGAKSTNTSPRSCQPSPETRKSPRGSRQKLRSNSENNDESGDEKCKELENDHATYVKEEKRETFVSNETEKIILPKPTVQVLASKSGETLENFGKLEPILGIRPPGLEPVSLIDPVTGMLIPVRESEEGQYIPVSNGSGGQIMQRAVLTTALGQKPEVLRAKSMELKPASTTDKEKLQEHLYSAAQTVQANHSVINKPQSPVIQQNIQSPPVSVTSCTNTIVSGAVSVQSTTTSQSKLTSLKAHVLNATKLVNQAQYPVAVTKSTASNMQPQSIVQNVKPATLPINMPVTNATAPTPILNQHTNPLPTHSPVLNANPGKPISPVITNSGTPPNPKQHLLQAAKQQQQSQPQAQNQPQVSSSIVNLQQKISIVHPGPAMSPSLTQRIHLPIQQATINNQTVQKPSKAHILQAAGPIVVTGSLPSSNSQTLNLVTTQAGVGSIPLSRTPLTKPPVTVIEAPKVEVSMSGCIMVPAPSTQSRVTSISAYEASLHGSAGPIPSPGIQYGLVPPHRSQSPPLPPPAHHHVNTPQSYLQGDVANHYAALSRVGELSPHYMHPQVLQYQYLRAQQEALTAPRIPYHVPSPRSPHLPPLDSKLEGAGEESPPLELCRGTRTPQERTTDSPQIAQVYMMHGAGRLPPPPPQFNAGNVQRTYYDPPPAHLRTPYESPVDRALTPDRARKHLVATPPQVPPPNDSLVLLLQRYPVMWQGLLALKNDQAAVQMHFVFGNPNVARDSLPCNSDGSTPPLRIAQRMRLEPTQVEGVARKMQVDNEHCMLLALPCGRDHMDVLQQSKNLQTGFITYLQQKQAAGIVNIAAPGSQQPAYVVHIFPSCDFANENLARTAPDLMHRVAEIAHLLIVIATV